MQSNGLSLDNGLAAEDRCLLLLARSRLTPEVRDRARSLLAQELSWPRILRQARVHGVFPLISRNLEKLGFLGVPPEVCTELTAADRLNAARNGLFVRALTRVLKRFGEAGVPVIPLKGVALAQSLYGDSSLRVCSDVDILIQRRAVAQAFDLLLSDGYERGEAHVEPSDIELLLHSNIEYGFVTKAGRVPSLLELHWDIAWRWRGDSAAPDDLWAEAERREFWGVDAYALSTEWEILYLAVHAARHRWQALKWLVDIHEACSVRAVDWAKLGDKAKRLGWEEVLGVTLSICHALLGTPVPDELARRDPPRWLRVFPESPAQPGLWQEALVATRLLGGLSAKLAYLGRLLFLPTIRERQLLRLPFPIDLLYYPMRPLRLAGRWSSRNHGG